jgi:hypothetical protein
MTAGVGGGLGTGREQRGQLGDAERSKVRRQRRPRATEAVGEAPHALGRGDVVGAAGRERQDPPVVDVVGEIDQEVERRRIRPVDVLEHQQQRHDGCSLAQPGQRLLEEARLGVGTRQRAQRAERLDEGLVGQVSAEQVDRAADQHLEPDLVGPLDDLRGKSGLADPRLAGHKDRRPVAGRPGGQRLLELLELVHASDERLAHAGLHTPSMAP